MLVALFFSPYLLGLAAFAARDFTQLFLPFSLFQQESLLGLRLPIWDPHTNAGHPYLADPQAAVFYPISNAILLLTGLDSSVSGRLYWLHAEAALHLFLGSAFTYMLVRRLTGQRLAAFASGLIFGFSGYLTGYPPLQLGILRTAVWLPLILFLLLPRVPGDYDWRRWMKGAAVHAVAFFAGHPQTFLFLTYAVGGWMLMLGSVELLRLFKPNRSPRYGTEVSEVAIVAIVAEVANRPFLQVASSAALYVLTLIALSLGQLWPTFEFAQHSVRSFVPYDYLSGGFPWQDSWQFILPGILTEFSPQYIGVAGLGLAIVGVAAYVSTAIPRSTDQYLARPAALFFIVCGGAALLLSYGANGPLYGLFFRYAPGGNLFRGQERAIYLVAFSLSVLGGYGLALLPSFSASVRRRMGWGLFVAIFGAVFTIFSMWLLPARVQVSAFEFWFLALRALLVAGAVALLCHASHLSRTRRLLFLPLLVGDLFFANFATNLAEGPAIRAELARPVAQATLQTALDLARESDGPPPRVYNEFRLPDSSGLFVGWEDVWGSSPMRIFYYDSLFYDIPLELLWQLTGVGTVLTWREDLSVSSQILAEFPREGETDRIHRLDRVAPRLWWTQKARRGDDKEVARLLADPNFNFREEILIGRAGSQSVESGWLDDRLVFGEGGTASIQPQQAGPANLVVRIQSDQPGILFASENWMPGWLAAWTPDGQEDQTSNLPVLRAHQAFLGIPIPAGDGALELRYRPTSVRWGLAVSGLSWLALLVVFRKAVWDGIRQTVGRAWRYRRGLARSGEAAEE